MGMQVMLPAPDKLPELGSFYTPATSVVNKGKHAEAWSIDPLNSEPNEIRDQEIADRLLGAIFLPVLQELDEEVAGPADIDLGAALALKFGKPPCALMDTLGREAVEQMILPLVSYYDSRMPESLERVGSLTI